MLCLSDSIRHDDPSVQQLLKTIEEAQTLTQLILAVWPFTHCPSPFIFLNMSSPSVPNGRSPGPPVRAVGPRCAVRALPSVNSRACSGLSDGD